MKNVLRNTWMALIQPVGNRPRGRLQNHIEIGIPMINVNNRVNDWQHITYIQTLQCMAEEFDSKYNTWRF